MTDGHRPDEPDQPGPPEPTPPGPWILPADGTDDHQGRADDTAVIPAVSPVTPAPFESTELFTAGGFSTPDEADEPAEPADATALIPSAMVGPSEGPAERPRNHNEIRPPRDRVRTVARGIGQTLITAGMVVLLFVVYEVYVTDIFGHEKQVKATTALEQAWATVQPSTAGTTAAGSKDNDVVTVTDPNKLVVNPATRKRNYKTLNGQGFARIYVPSFGADYSFTIIEGTTTDDLYAGPGHYEKTQYPGEKGNFAVAGHRVSKGSPFNNLGLLNSCDAIVIETQSEWFVYRVLPMANEIATWTSTQHAHCDGVKPQTGQYADVLGREITVPSDYAQVLPVPHVESTTVPADAERLITLTTCHPQFSDTQRMIIHGVLVKTYKKSGKFLPPELNES
ncbi:LPXTG-site transpeptidase (sortase) family protein [Nakamurella panacisegetis]|uniref:LPXTG-site transpeptidase (Sortase) family protein n=1 Tax=Nakamurella panacisegetis TaxID=1090615 RepID=A0A1H0KQV1_9ACTN|nr:class E sortase [Nakamurella panacisegetis]SDO58151.1 LPXTG-site transpeptidase (sortase) family protein [Nakamurella panacisegetis]